MENPPGAHWVPLTDLSFTGGRFASHSLELEIGQELAEFQRIVTQLAADLWRAENHTRQRLPAHFEEETKLRFKRIEESSTKLPLEAPIEFGADSLLGPAPSPYLIQAVQILIDTVRAQTENRELPSRFPRERIAAIANWGAKLNPDEAIIIGNGQPESRAVFTQATRSQLREYTASNYDDLVTIYGEVRAVNLDNGESILRLPDQRRIRVKIGTEEQQGGLFTDAMRRSASIRLTGLGEISRVDGYIKSLRVVTSITLLAPENDETLAAWIEGAESRNAWDGAPSDAAMHLDKYLYKTG